MMARKTSSEKSNQSPFFLFDLSLTSINAQRMGPATEASEVQRKNSVELSEISGDFFTVKASEHVYFKSSGPFRLDIEVTGRFGSIRTVDEPTIMEHFDEVSQPVLSYSAYLISVITREMVGLPLVLEPIIVKD